MVLTQYTWKKGVSCSSPLLFLCNRGSDIKITNATTRVVSMHPHINSISGTSTLKQTVAYCALIFTKGFTSRLVSLERQYKMFERIVSFSCQAIMNLHSTKSVMNFDVEGRDLCVTGSGMTKTHEPCKPAGSHSYCYTCRQ